MKSNQYQRVKDLLHKYTIIQPSNAQAFCLMAEVLLQTNDIEHAKSWSVEKQNFHELFCILFLFRYLQALSTHRLDAHLQRRIGEVIDLQGDKSDAIQYYFDVRI
jgi:hypothetical protein